MATITGLTAGRMLDIESASIVAGSVVGDNLILTTEGGVDINAGDVRGPVGPTGAAWSGTYLMSESATVYAPVLGGSDITYPHVDLTLAVGTWFVIAQAAVQSNQVDAIAISVVDTGPVKRIQGATNTAAVVNSAISCVAVGFIVVASTMTIKILAQRNGSSVLSVGNATAMNPAQRISALKIV